MINMLVSAVFFTLLAILLHFAEVTGMHAVGIWLLFMALDLTSYAMGLKKGIEL